MSGRARYFVLFMFFFAGLAGPVGTAPMTPDHRPWGELLQTYVAVPPAADRGAAPHFVDYSGLKADKYDRAALGAYIESLEAVDPATLPRDEQFAFWANLYNALTVQVVVDHYPVASIRDISISPGLFARGPWGKKLVRVASPATSRSTTSSTRSCAPNSATPASTTRSIAPPGAVRTSPSSLTKAQSWTRSSMRRRGATSTVRAASNSAMAALTVSSIFSWYKKDFGGTEASLLAHLRRYAEPELAAALAKATRASSYDYDWSLNDAARLEEIE